MQDSKESAWNTGYDKDADLDNGAANDDNQPPEGKPDDTDGWQQYRRWISKAPAPNRRRNGIDPSLYTWKGYRSWTEQVKRNWDDSSSS